MCLSILVHRPDLEIEQGYFQDHEYAITANDMGYRCGYIKLDPGHPWHGMEYPDIDAEVHGGLTFSEPDEPCTKTGSDNGYWIGFDCGHGFDAPDPDLRGDGFTFMTCREHQTIRTTDYVRANIHQLITQANAAINS